MKTLSAALATMQRSHADKIGMVSYKPILVYVQGQTFHPAEAVRVTKTTSSIHPFTSTMHNAKTSKSRSLSLHFIPIMMCVVGAMLSPTSHAQTLKPTEQKKVNLLRARYNKALAAQKQAQAKLETFRVFHIMGKVRAGDTNQASIYGLAIQESGSRGPGTLNDKNYLTVISPAEGDYSGDNYNGYCLFVGVKLGVNTYVSVSAQPDYLAALAEARKWEPIVSSIQAEVDAIYLPYRRKEKNQATAQASQQARLAKVEAQNQARVNTAREQLEKEKRDLEQAKAQRASKEAADAEMTRLAAELEKTRAEKARLEAEEQQKAKDAADLKAKQLLEAEEKKQTALDALKNAASLVPGEQLGKVRLGMSEAQVLQVLGTPASSLPLKKFGEDENGNLRSRSSQLRRDRYALPATEGLNIFYEGTDYELWQYAQERGLEKLNAGDLKTKFVLDVYYLDGKVVQAESDSPEFFTRDKQNLQNVSDLLTSLGPLYKAQVSFLDGPGYYERGFYHYWGSREKGLSFCLELPDFNNSRRGMYRDSDVLLKPPALWHMKVVVHRAGTVPYTGDRQQGISVVNRKGNEGDADNREERLHAVDLNPTVAQTVVATVVKPSTVKEKLRNKLGAILRSR